MLLLLDIPPDGLVPLREDEGVSEQLGRVGQGRSGLSDGSDGVESIVGACVGRVQVVFVPLDLGLPLLDRRRECLADVLGQSVEGQRGLVGADVHVLGDAFAGALGSGGQLGVNNGGCGCCR